MDIEDNRPDKSKKKAEFSSSETTYNGPERRKENRRKQPDRRENVRFEPGKEDRRKSRGRRKGDLSGNHWTKTTI